MPPMTATATATATRPGRRGRLVILAATLALAWSCSSPSVMQCFSDTDCATGYKCVVGLCTNGRDAGVDAR